MRLAAEVVAMMGLPILPSAAWAIRDNAFSTPYDHHDVQYMQKSVPGHAGEDKTMVAPLGKVCMAYGPTPCVHIGDGSSFLRGCRQLAAGSCRGLVGQDMGRHRGGHSDSHASLLLQLPVRGSLVLEAAQCCICHACHLHEQPAHNACASNLSYVLACCVLTYKGAAGRASGIRKLHKSS